MTKAQRFAVNQWLSDYPKNASYSDIMEMLWSDDHEWVHEDLTVWCVVENYPLTQVAEFIDDTRRHFESVTQGEPA